MTRPLWLVVLLTITSPALAATWTASGVFQYQDRDWDNTGLLNSVTVKPIRYADVQVFDVNETGNPAILANTKTDANGVYSIAVSDNRIRTVAVRVLSSTDQTSDLFVKVVGPGDFVYSAETPPVSGHNQSADVNFGTVVLEPTHGGEVFNILDLAIYGADFIKVLTGSRPSNNKRLTIHWAINGGVGGSSTSWNVISLRDSAGYDDPPILHEWAHYIMFYYSRATSPGGDHYLEECVEPLGLAFDEGRASAFGAFVRRYYGMPSANWYIKTDGASGSGHLVNAYNLETDTEYSCYGDTSEVAVSRSLWDIGDSASTTDDTPGVDDDPPDALALPDLETWQVFNGPLKSGQDPVNLERFWDGWFNPLANGFKPEMTEIFSAWVIEFFEDANEPNNTAATATLIVPDGEGSHNTYFDDPDGDGKGQADTDYFKFSAVSGTPYTIRTENLLSDANTKLELFDTNGTTLLATNDDQSSEDPSSLILWTALQSGVYYIRSTHSPDVGIYGSYDLVVEAPPCGTTFCGLSFCIDPPGSDLCHPGPGACSGNYDSGWNTCVQHAEPVYTLPPPRGGPAPNVLWSCPAGQHVHLQLCPCTCLGNSCGSHYAVLGCE